MVKNTYVIVGGVAGGASCAVRLRRLDEEAEIIVLERGEYVSYANCGLPYYIGDYIKDREKLLVETPEKLNKNFNLDVRIESEALEIDPKEKKVKVRDHINNNEYEINYDKLVLSPGAKPLRPPIPGINNSTIFTLRTVPDTDKIKTYIENKHPKHAVVVGGGYIGLEMAENLAHQGIKVTVVELLDQVMGPLDFEMAAYVHQHLKSQDVELYLGNGVTEFKKNEDETLTVILQDGEEIETNMVMMSVGVKPESKLAEDAGLELGKRGGIVVDSHMKTSNEDIFAIGDAVLVKDYINGKSAHIPLAGPANKQGRIVANQIVGREDEYNGTQGTSIAKIFELTIATTGNNEKTLKKYDIPYKKSYTQNSSHAGYYPGAIPMAIKTIFSPENGKILGAQIVGYEGVDKRIDVFATAIRAGMTTHDLEELELAYAPPYSSAKDPVNIAGFVASNILKGDMEVIYWDEVDELNPEKTFILDIRTELEAKIGEIEGSVNIPLDELRDRLDEIPKDNTVVVYCQAGQRGYYAARILMLNGYDVKNLSGGYKAYKITQEEQSNVGLFDDLSIRVNDWILGTSNEQEEPDHQSDLVIDACGLACPGPIMKVAENIKGLNSGEILKISATDPGFESDIQSWAEQTGNKLVNFSKDGTKLTAFLKKGAKKSEAPAKRAQGYPDGKTMVVFSGDLDKALAAFIIANGAASMGKKVNLFFTFWGLNVLRKNRKVKVKKTLIEKLFGKMMPRGSKKLKLSRMNMFGMGTSMIKKIMEKHNVSSLEELIQSAIDNGVNLIACQMTMDLMGIKKEELIDGVNVGGVATFLGKTDQSNASLFI